MTWDHKSSGVGWCCGTEEEECFITGIMYRRALSSLRASSCYLGGEEGEEGDDKLVNESAADDYRMLRLIYDGYGDYLSEEE